MFVYNCFSFHQKQNNFFWNFENVAGFEFQKNSDGRFEQMGDCQDMQMFLLVGHSLGLPLPVVYWRIKLCRIRV